MSSERSNDPVASPERSAPDQQKPWTAPKVTPADIEATTNGAYSSPDDLLAS